MYIQALIQENWDFIIDLREKLLKFYSLNNNMLSIFDYYSENACDEDILNCQELLMLNETISNLISALNK